MRRGYRTFGLLIVVAVPLILGSCSLMEDLFGEPKSGQALWNSHEIDRYQYTLERTCFCMPGRLEATVHVENGQVVSIADVRGGGEPYDGASRSDFKSIEQLFALIEEAEREGAAVVRVTYHSELGYPTDIHIDRDERLADEEVFYRASHVVIDP